MAKPKMKIHRNIWEGVGEGCFLCSAKDVPSPEGDYVALGDAQRAVLAERERCEQLFLLFAYDWWGDKIKDSSAKETIEQMLADIRSGEKPHAWAVFNSSDSNRRGLPTIMLYDREADFSHETTSPSTTSSAGSGRED